MRDEEYWSAVTKMRLGIADLLESLSSAQWNAPSLCAGWRVRDVGGHLALVPTITTGQMIAAAPRAGFSPHRINTRLARRYGDGDPAGIVAAIREHAGARGTARALDTRNALFDLVVHSQDIALAVGRDFPVDPEHSRAGLQRVWEMGWPFHARRRLSSYTLKATDTHWEAGAGPEVSGPALALLLLLTGRTAAAIGSLRGDGRASVGQLEADHATDDHQ